ncbi:type III polyketide synthase [Rubrobacter aplysinae]|uniref:type III polyketide synthase n=1 Tax=Rubrobacter aplysinae TaxID=909625 RepID=UPI00064BA509|nr:3-oxoacyl-[acyl-carrier-protein] synthase III C-terminal domain-containing protein [Rubrobacter aplysinae]
MEAIPGAGYANPSVLSVATALPPYRAGQEEIKDFARRMFSGRNVERLMPVFDNSGVQTRYFCAPLEWFHEEHSFPEKNALYVKYALDLSEKAAREAMQRAGASPEDIGAIFFFSTSGVSTPSLDSKLILRLGLSEHTRRVPIWGLGCAAGAAALARAADHARLHPGKLVLLVGAESSSLTLQRGDLSKSNLVSMSLFGDGAAAVVLGAGGARENGSGTPELLGDYSTLWSGTEDVMGWELVETGLKVRLSRSVPEIVLGRMRENVEAACEANGVAFGELRRFVLHPGGAKVLDAFEEVLDLPADSLAESRGILRDCGNMSSVTVLFILERLLRQGDYAAGEAGILSAMGPGFSAEHVLFRL